MFDIIIETDNFIIRPFKIEDLDDVYLSWGKDKKMYDNISLKYPLSKKEMNLMILDWIKEYEQDSYNWCFSIIKDSHSIGFIRFKDYRNKAGGIISLECGLSSVEWNKGYMSECLLAFVKYALLKLDINRVEARCDNSSKSAIRVLEKCGMFFEGISRSSGENNSKSKYDESVYSLVRNDI